MGVKLALGLGLAVAPVLGTSGLVPVIGAGEPVVEDPFSGSSFGSGLVLGPAGLGCKVPAGLTGAVVVLPCCPALPDCCPLVLPDCPPPLPLFVCAEINEIATAQAARIPNNFV